MIKSLIITSVQDVRFLCVPPVLHPSHPALFHSLHLVVSHLQVVFFLVCYSCFHPAKYRVLNWVSMLFLSVCLSVYQSFSYCFYPAQYRVLTGSLFCSLVSLSVSLLSIIGLFRTEIGFYFKMYCLVYNILVKHYYILGVQVYVILSNYCLI